MNPQANFHPTLLKLETTRDERLRAHRAAQARPQKTATPPEVTRRVYGRLLRFAIRA
jgi:hypothetical protein